MKILDTSFKMTKRRFRFTNIRTWSCFLCFKQFEWNILRTKKLLNLCADLESFARGGSTFTFFSWWGEKGSKYLFKRAIIGQPAKRHFSVPMMAQHWMLAWQLCNVQGIQTRISKNPYIFVIFQGGGSRPPVPPLDPQMKLTFTSTLWSNSELSLLMTKECLKFPAVMLTWRLLFIGSTILPYSVSASRPTIIF